VTRAKERVFEGGVTETEARDYFQSFIDAGAFSPRTAISVKGAAELNGSKRKESHLLNACLELGLPLVAKRGVGTWIATTDAEVTDYVRVRRQLAEGNAHMADVASRLTPYPVCAAV
jgi:hypothetical protein